ncbi:MAG: hypothetical protein A3B68_00175 [Candidatus Melainabacteria bacterium RIFCSPHIGHO2_02_FULL_34_12]|nr:MAG: hypothetical protein A3B68_00175 [Candidatus Melainabacteria bacterium RIFCSPHIGHO2_02_FULL_34_12]
MKSVNNFKEFKNIIKKEFFAHPVIVNNPYTKWFKEGNANTEQIKDLILQFSVFSNHFIVVQAKRMVNANTLEGEESARAILLNECGVGMDVQSGSIEGKRFTTSNAHINWLRKIADLIDIDPKILGRWEIGTNATHEFLEGLDKTYGSHDGQIGSGASFAIETWAAYGIGKSKEEELNNFWKELILGLEIYNQKNRIPKNLTPLPTGFFQYHFETESGHELNVWQELEQTYTQPDFNESKYLKAGKTALDSIYTFWLGLDETRKKL